MLFLFPVDSEAVRLLSEVEQSISLLPTMVGSTNIQAELALALQPLRSENVQLRRLVPLPQHCGAQKYSSNIGARWSEIFSEVNYPNLAPEENFICLIDWLLMEKDTE